MTDADVIVVGGGVAGSAAALLLGRAGFTVELYEKARHPREKPCGEGLMPTGVAVLRRLGLLDGLEGAPLKGIRYHGWGQTLAGSFGQLPGLGVRRRQLDRTLFEAAQGTPGVTAWQGVKVEDPLWDGRRVTGVCVDGQPRRAPLVVAADGAQSLLRRRLGLEGPPQPRRRVGLRSHFRRPPGVPALDHVEIFLGPDHELYLTPLPAGECLVAGLGPFPLPAPSGRSQLAQWIGQHGSLGQHLAGAEPLTEPLGRAPLTVRARQTVLPGLVLLGDAAGSEDPITGGGMAQGLLSAELLVQVLTGTAPGARGVRRGRAAPAWRGPHPEPLWAFAHRQRRLLRHYRWVTGLLLWLSARPAWARCALRLLKGQPWLVDHLVAVAGCRRTLWGSALATEPPAAPAEPTA